MKKLLSTILILVLLTGLVSVGSADVGSRVTAELMKQSCEDVISKLYDEYKKTGDLADGYIEELYVYYKIHELCERAISLESVAPGTTIFPGMGDMYRELERAVDSEWEKYLDGKQTKENIILFVTMMIGLK